MSDNLKKLVQAHVQPTPEERFKRLLANGRQAVRECATFENRENVLRSFENHGGDCLEAAKILREEFPTSNYEI